MLPLVEICVDDVAGALAAEQAGADRIELCSALSEGGLTPSIGMAGRVLAQVRRIGVQVLIRPRGGDFIVSPEECEVMLADIAAIRALPHARAVVLGFVLGALTPEGKIDEPVMRRLVAACGDVPVTFHKAFDLVSDLAAGLTILADLGVTRVLTSGGKASALEGAEILNGLVHQAAGRITIMAGGGVRANNVRAILAATGVSEVHLRAMRSV
ncbi:MAG: copper homeostasis protein CutC, partial [Dongiaceae bacterium]